MAEMILKTIKGDTYFWVNVAILAAGILVGVANVVP